MTLVSETLRRRGSIAVVVLVSLLAGTIPVPHTNGLDDPDCFPLLMGHNERAHHFGAAPISSPVSSEHCFLCHSLRSLHQPQERQYQRDLVPGSEQLYVAGRVASARAEWLPTAGRAPPRSIS
jgi:hypothetical protein